MTVQGIINAFTKKYPDRTVADIFVLNKKQVLIEAPKKGSIGASEPCSFIADYTTGNISELNPMENIDAYTKAHNPKRRIYSKD